MCCLICILLISRDVAWTVPELGLALSPSSFSVLQFTKSSNSIHLVLTLLQARFRRNSFETGSAANSSVHVYFSLSATEKSEKIKIFKKLNLKADLLPAFSTFVNLQEESAKKLQFLAETVTISGTGHF